MLFVLWIFVSGVIAVAAVGVYGWRQNGRAVERRCQFTWGDQWSWGEHRCRRRAVTGGSHCPEHGGNGPETAGR